MVQAPSDVLTQPSLARRVGGDVRGWLLLLSALVVVADRWSKLAVEQHLMLGGAHTVIPNIFRITHVLNTGAAFSAFAQTASPLVVRYALIGFSALAIAIVATLLWRSGREFTISGLAFALILGGAIGNLYDRIWLHYVVDFLEVHIFQYHWPDFNIADSAIVIGACLLIIEVFRPQTRKGESA